LLDQSDIIGMQGLFKKYPTVLHEAYNAIKLANFI